MKKNAIFKLLLAVLALIIGIFSIYFYVLCSFFSSNSYVDHIDVPFNAEIWKSFQTNADNQIRYKMYNDLIAKHCLEGMSKDNIISLLGPSTETKYFNDWDLKYWLGPEMGRMKIDSVWLVIKIEDNKVKKYKLVTD